MVVPQRSLDVLTVLLVGVLVGRSTWDTGQTGVAYTFTNHCGEDLVLEALGDGATLTLPEGEVGVLRTFAQEPDETFVVRRTDGTDDVQVAPGMSTYAIEGDDCPSDR